MATARGRRSKQLQLAFPTWGGARAGAGRKPNGAKAGVSHLRRPPLPRRFPVHVTWRVLPHVWSLRSRRSFRIVGAAVRASAERFGMRLCEFSVQGNLFRKFKESLWGCFVQSQTAKALQKH